jgi:hypothetical protein
VAQKLEPIPTDSDLTTLMAKQPPIPDNGDNYPLGQMILPMSVNRFFEVVVGEGAVFGLDIHSKEDQGHTDVVVGKWMKPSESPEYAEVTLPEGTLVRKQTMVVPVSGVPFCHTTRVEKHLTYIRPKAGVLVWTVKSKALDVPYGDFFENTETWRIVSTSDTAISCIVRAECNLKFVKSTFFESKIRGRSKEEYLAAFKVWNECLEKRGLAERKEKQKVIQV